MKYKINDFLFYDAATGALKPDDNAKSDIQLTITANALLFFLIQHPGIVSRDEVIQRVWDDNGLVSSYSNLNQYLSLLRKTFRVYGIDNVIVTVARGRLEINPSLKIEIIEDAAHHPIMQSAIVSNNIQKEQQDHNTQSSHYHRYTWFYAASGALILAMIIFLWSWHVNNKITAIKLYPVIEQPVTLFSLDKITHAVVKESYINNFFAVKDKKNINNTKGEYYLFFYADKLQTNGLGRVFLAHCAKHGENIFSYCDNYFYYSWK